MITSLINQIKENTGKQIALIDIDISPHEIKIFNNFNITVNKTYKNFGNLNNLEENITKFLTEIGTNSLNDIGVLKDFIIRLLYSVLEGFEKNSFWLDIRVTLPNDQWIVPRWHNDGKFYTTQTVDQPNYKFIMTIKGPGTLFATCDEPTKKEFRELAFSLREHDPFNIEYREKMDKIIKKCMLFQAKQNQGAIFATGNPSIAAIHSEPNMNESRIFISILPGTIEEINELKLRWRVKD